jgi:hypothetical protein
LRANLFSFLGFRFGNFRQCAAFVPYPTLEAGSF